MGVVLLAILTNPDEPNTLSSSPSSEKDGVAQSEPTIDDFEFHGVTLTSENSGRIIKMRGEVTNRAGRHFEFVGFRPALYDRAGTVLETSAITFRNLRNGETRFFDCAFDGEVADPHDVDSYRFQFATGY